MVDVYGGSSQRRIDAFLCCFDCTSFDASHVEAAQKNRLYPCCATVVALSVWSRVFWKDAPTDNSPNVCQSSCFWTKILGSLTTDVVRSTQTNKRIICKVRSCIKMFAYLESRLQITLIYSPCASLSVRKNGWSINVGQHRRRYIWVRQ